MAPATSSGRTNWVAPAKPAVVGRSALTAQPPANQRNWSCARSVAVATSGSQLIGIWPMARAVSPICGAPSALFQAVTRSSFGSTAIRWSASGANRATDFSPLTASAISTLFGQVPDPCGVHAEVLPVVRHQVAAVELADHLDRLREHVLADVDARPALPDDVLVEVLPGAEAEGEPAVGEDLERRGLLGHDGRVVAQDRAGHVGHQLDPLGHLGDGAEHGPGVRRVTLGR